MYSVRTLLQAECPSTHDGDTEINQILFINYSTVRDKRPCTIKYCQKKVCFVCLTSVFFKFSQVDLHCHHIVQVETNMLSQPVKIRLQKVRGIVRFNEHEKS